MAMTAAATVRQKLDVAEGEVLGVAADRAGDGVPAAVGQLFADLGVDVHPLGQVEPAAELWGTEFVPGGVPVDIGGDQHQEALCPGVGRAGAVPEVRVGAEVSGEQEAALGEQGVADGVGAFEVEPFHDGSGRTSMSAVLSEVGAKRVQPPWPKARAKRRVRTVPKRIRYVWRRARSVGCRNPVARASENHTAVPDFDGLLAACGQDAAVAVAVAVAVDPVVVAA